MPLSSLFESDRTSLRRKFIRVVTVTNNIVKLKKTIEERVVKEKLDINKIVLHDEMGYSPLLYASAYGTKEVVSTLLLYGKANAKEKTLGGANAVLVACLHALPSKSDVHKTHNQRNLVELLKFLLDDMNLPANSTDKKGNNALHILLSNAGLFSASNKVNLLKEALIVLLDRNCKFDIYNAKHQKPFDELVRHATSLDSPKLRQLFHSKQLILAQARVACELNLTKPAGLTSSPSITLQTYEQLKSI